MPDRIQHVVLLMLENHSFDQMIGSLQGTPPNGVYPDLDGISPNSPQRFNLNLKGEKIPQAPVEEKQMHLDPLHEVEAVAEQMSNNNGGFVTNFEKNTATRRRKTSPSSWDIILWIFCRLCTRWLDNSPSATVGSRLYRDLRGPTGSLPFLGPLQAASKCLMVSRSRTWPVFFS
jgi:hypothetical protein